MSRHHEIPATPENMVWGYFDAAVPPVLEVDSGDTVTLTSWMAGYQAQLHPDPARVDPLHLRGARGGAAGAGPALRDRPGVRPRRGAGRRAADRHPRAQLPLRLGLHLHPAAAGHDPGRLRCLRDHAPGHRSRARRDGAALGQGDRARSVLRGDRRGAAARIGAAARRRRRAPSAATWTTRSCGRGRPSICPVFNEGALFMAATGMASRATARSASARWRRRSPAASA